MFATRSFLANLSTKGQCFLGRAAPVASVKYIDLSRTRYHLKPLVRTVSGIAITKDQSREFMAVFPDIVRELNEGSKHIEVPEVSRGLTEMLQYNVPVGKKNRGLALVISYKMLENPDHLTPENIKRAIIMGWCVEMFQAFCLILDDIMNESSTRRGRPCWYKLEHVGLRAVNDAMLIQTAMFAVVKKHFRNQPYYERVVETFNEMITKTSTGQYLDMKTKIGGKPDLSRFTMKYYNEIVQYKRSYYTFQLPVILAMLMSGIQDPEMYRQAQTILLEMGQFFQMQEDYLHCFGDINIIANDIQNGKCSWLAVVALQRANSEQKKVMEKYYGTGDPQDAEIIKKLYEELSLPKTYSTYEKTSYDTIKTHIQQISRGLPHTLFINIMDNIYGRKS